VGGAFQPREPYLNPALEAPLTQDTQSEKRKQPRIGTDFTDKKARNPTAEANTTSARRKSRNRWPRFHKRGYEALACRK